MRNVNLFRQRLVWMPTIAGWLVLLLIGIATSILLATNLYAFLAPNEPAGARVLVVEGWLRPEELEQAIQAFRNGKYERIVTTGGPVTGWPESSIAANYAKLAADFLERRGIRPDLIAAVAAPKAAQERTYLSALMFRESLQQFGIKLDAVDVFSAGPHARRSRLLFQMALGPEVKVGILAARPGEFDPNAWWQSSSGVEQMAFQTLGFIWVKCCFWPEPPVSAKKPSD